MDLTVEVAEALVPLSLVALLDLLLLLGKEIAEDLLLTVTDQAEEVVRVLQEELELVLLLDQVEQAYHQTFQVHLHSTLVAAVEQI